MAQHYETTDIFIGAFILSKGGSLSGIRIMDAARGIAAFAITGENLDQLDREYRTGRALVNPVHLRDSLNLLEICCSICERGGEMIEKERIEAIKRDVDLVGLIEARGVKLKKNGIGYKGHCPFHDDQKTPSFSVTSAKNLWQCFGCGKGGDPIEFVRLFDQVEFKEAVAKLETSPAGAASTSRKSKTAVKEETGEKKPLTAGHIKLLARVIGFYHTAFCEDPRAREYLEKRSRGGAAAGRRLCSRWHHPSRRPGHQRFFS